MDWYMEQYSACSCSYRRLETCTWCVSNKWKSVLHLWYALNYNKCSVSQMVVKYATKLGNKMCNICPKFVSRTSFKPPHDKTNKMAYAPSKDSDQPGHPPSLIRVRMKKPRVLSYPMSAHRRFWCPGWSECSLGAQSFCWFVMMWLVFRTCEWQCLL